MLWDIGSICLKISKYHSVWIVPKHCIPNNEAAAISFAGSWHRRLTNELTVEIINNDTATHPIQEGDMVIENSMDIHYLEVFSRALTYLSQRVLKLTLFVKHQNFVPLRIQNNPMAINVKNAIYH